MNVPRRGIIFTYSPTGREPIFSGLRIFPSPDDKTSFYDRRGTQENSNARDSAGTARVRGCQVRS